MRVLGVIVLGCVALLFSSSSASGSDEKKAEVVEKLENLFQKMAATGSDGEDRDLQAIGDQDSTFEDPAVNNKNDGYETEADKYEGEYQDTVISASGSDEEKAEVVEKLENLFQKMAAAGSDDKKNAEVIEILNNIFQKMGIGDKEKQHDLSKKQTLFVDCHWEGTAPFCEPDPCVPGEVVIQTDDCGDGACCWVGHKKKCCGTISFPGK